MKIRKVNHPAIQSDVWLPPHPLGPKTLRSDPTGIRHKIYGFNDYDSRLVLSECGLLGAWPFHNPNTANKSYSDCEECFG